MRTHYRKCCTLNNGHIGSNFCQKRALFPMFRLRIRAHCIKKTPITTVPTSLPWSKRIKSKQVVFLFHKRIQSRPLLKTSWSQKNTVQPQYRNLILTIKIFDISIDVSVDTACGNIFSRHSKKGRKNFSAHKPVKFRVNNFSPYKFLLKHAWNPYFWTNICKI
jgi:hypothetical protein